MAYDLIWLILLLLLPGIALLRRLPVYDLFVTGAKEGLRVALQILPNLAAMLVAVSLMEATGLTAFLCRICAPVLTWLGLPAEIAPLVALRPLSGSAALAVLEQLLNQYGADSRIGLLASVAMGSSETIFYTVCVYLSSCKDRRTGYAIPCALAGMIAGLWTAGRFWR
ncbi:MAG: spore maturation protein [Clostridiales bacterium]|nr:spore maturation protein [Clostridiales bacterium]